MPAEDFAFSMCTGMLGRLYLSGRLDLMTAEQLASVRAAVQVHQEMRSGLTTAVPLWPLGLPAWSDPWLSLALQIEDVTYLAVWQRDGDGSGVSLALPHLRDRQIDVDVLYPRELPAWTCQWNSGAGSLTVLPSGPAHASARLFRIVSSPTEGSAQ
jgi:alpha-galactosidase